MVTAEAIIGQGHTRRRVHGFYVNQCNVLNLYVMCSTVLNLLENKLPYVMHGFRAFQIHFLFYKIIILTLQTINNFVIFN